jgi:hypothetical protein
MDSATRKSLEELALQRLAATADDEEPWSFLFRTDGAVGRRYWPLSQIEDREFDGMTEGLDLQWSAERLEAIAGGAADLTDEEKLQWRQAKARSLAAGAEDAWPVWIVPLWIENETAGHALFLLDGAGGPEDPPILEGVFGSVEEAKDSLRTKGALDKD